MQKTSNVLCTFVYVLAKYLMNLTINLNEIAESNQSLYICVWLYFMVNLIQNDCYSQVTFKTPRRAETRSVWQLLI